MIDKIMMVVALMSLLLTFFITCIVFTQADRLVLEEITVRSEFLEEDELQIYGLVSKMIDHVMIAINNDDYPTACEIQKKIVQLIEISSKQILLKEAQNLEKSLCQRQREQMI